MPTLFSFEAEQFCPLNPICFTFHVGSLAFSHLHVKITIVCSKFIPPTYYSHNNNDCDQNALVSWIRCKMFFSH
jgi:hypothetical protein